MAHADANKHEAMTELRAVFQQYHATPLPRLGHLARYAADADVDLFAEDSYLAGLVSTALTTGRISVDAIVLDRNIDTRLEDLANIYGDRALQAMIDYRKSMRRLAALLSTATSVPTRD